MKRSKGMILLLGVFVFLASGIAFTQEDRKGCRDHPMFTRMPNFYIEKCKEYDFDQADFVDEKGKDIKVEGKYYWAEYEIKKGHKQPSALEIRRNFESAIKKIGGVVVKEKGGGILPEIN